jgi:hypothetical protein
LYLSQNIYHDELRNTHSYVYSSFMSFETFTTLVHSIPEGVVEHWTVVHPICTFTSIWCDCLGWLVGMWEGDYLSSSSCMRNLAVHCLFVRSQTKSYQVIEILWEDRTTKRFALAYLIRVCISYGNQSIGSLLDMIVLSILVYCYS